MSKSWMVMSRNRPPETFDIGRRAAAGIAAGDHHLLDLADLAGVDAVAHRLERRVEATVEADHDRRLERADLGPAGVDALR